MRNYLLATTAIAILATPAAARDIASAIATPVQTSTANNGAPDAITITKDGSITVTGGAAVTMDSNHAVANNGSITINNAEGATGILVTPGRSAAISNGGTITVGESYTPEDVDKDGDLDGPFALGSNRAGIRVQGAHNGALTHTGTIAVKGNDSFGITLGGPLTGALTHNGTTTVLGDRSTAVRVQDVTGNVRLAGTVAATGQGSVGAHFAGDIAGALEVQGTVAATGYRYTTAPADPTKLDADDLLQGGPALLVEGNVSGGIILAVPPPNANPNDDDEDGEGSKDADEGLAVVIAHGAAPAMAIGALDRDIAIGPVASSASKFGLVVDGTISGLGVYTGVSATGLVIGGRGGAVTVAEGIGVAGKITASSLNAQATALHLAGANVPLLQVTGEVSAATGNAANAQAIAVRVGEGAVLPRLTNSGTIKATAGENGTAIAIRDETGGLTVVENSGAISATGAKADSARNIAIDLSANTSGVTVRQLEVGAGFAAPAITGDVLLGSGDDTLSIADGKVTGNVVFGVGNNTLQLSGRGVQNGTVTFSSGADAVSLTGRSAFNGVIDFGGGADSLTIGGTAAFNGALTNSAGLAVALNGGTFAPTGTASIASLAVEKEGTLLVTLDKDAGEGTFINVGGTATFAKDATVAVKLADVHDAAGRYIVLQAGQLVGADGLKTDERLVPFLFKASIAEDAPANQLAIDVARRSATELGLNASQGAGFDAAFEALVNDDKIEQVFLGISNGDLFRYTVGQMLPDHAGGAFEGVSQGSRALALRLADPSGPVYAGEGLDIIVSAAGWSSDKPTGTSAAYDLNGLGFSAAAETGTRIGQLGLAAAWFWNEHSRGDDYTNVISNTYELSAYWRGEWGGLSTFGRGSIGKSDFEGRRTFVGMAGEERIERTVKGDWSGTLLTLSGGASFEGGWQYAFFRPAISLDYAKLDEDGYTDSGGGGALDLIVEQRKSDELAVNAGLTLGVDFNGMGPRDRNWLRVEAEGGWRELVGGALGSTTARFEDGDPFTLNPEQRDGGWVAALRALGGSAQFSVGGEVRVEERHSAEAVSVRGSLRMNF